MGVTVVALTASINYGMGPPVLVRHIRPLASRPATGTTDGEAVIGGRDKGMFLGRMLDSVQ